MKVEAETVAESVEELPGEVVDATALSPGDVIASRTFDVSRRAEVLKPAEEYVHPLMGPGFRYWAREVGTDREGWMTFGPGGVVRRLSAA